MYMYIFKLVIFNLIFYHIYEAINLIYIGNILTMLICIYTIEDMNIW